MSSENDPSCGQIYNVYQTDQGKNNSEFDGKFKVDHADTADTQEASKKYQKSKEVGLNSVRLEEQIRQVRNRINLIEITKNRNKGKLQSTVRKTSSVLDVRKFAAEKERVLEEKKKQEEREAKEMKDKVARLIEERSRVMEEKKEQQKKEKMAVVEKARKEKKEIREKLKQLEEDAKKVEPVKRNQYMKANSSVSRVDSSSTCTSVYKGLDSKNEKRVCPYGYGNSLTKKVNVYNQSSRSQTLSVEDLKNQLKSLVLIESKKIDELTTIVTKTRDAENKFKEITKTKIQIK